GRARAAAAATSDGRRRNRPSVPELARQRGQVFGRGEGGRRDAFRREGVGRDRGSRPGDRHRARRTAADLRALPSRRHGPRSRCEGKRAGLVDRAPHRRGPRRPGHGRQRTRGRKHVHDAAAGDGGGRLMPKVLIVEDDAAMATALKDGFTYEGYDVELARDGEAGLKAARAAAPDVVVLDVMLP